MPKKVVVTDSDRTLNRKYSGFLSDGTPRDWTTNVDKLSHEQYKRWWDRQFPGDAMSKRVAEMKALADSAAGIKRRD